MNDALMRFSSDWFYGGKVRSAAGWERFRSILELEKPITWIDTSQAEGGGERFVGESYGRVNDAEARLTLQVLAEFVERIGERRVLEENIDIGIISPYKAQVQQLRRMLRGSAALKRVRRLVTVNTVDGFQGQERDVILISMVRSNGQGQIGFLSDLRRMNVAMTRARLKLFILGDAETLTRHAFYRRLYEYVQSLD